MKRNLLIVIATVGVLAIMVGRRVGVLPRVIAGSDDHLDEDGRHPSDATAVAEAPAYRSTHLHTIRFALRHLYSEHSCLDSLFMHKCRTASAAKVYD